MTKDEEIHAWEGLIDSLPADAWYLRSILGDIRGAVCSAISNDFGFVDWSVHIDKQRAMKAEETDLAGRLTKLHQQIATAQKQQTALLDGLAALRTHIRELKAI